MIIHDVKDEKKAKSWPVVGLESDQLQIFMGLQFYIIISQCLFIFVFSNYPTASGFTAILGSFIQATI